MRDTYTPCNIERVSMFLSLGLGANKYKHHPLPPSPFKIVHQLQIQRLLNRLRDMRGRDRYDDIRRYFKILLWIECSAKADTWTCLRASQFSRGAPPKWRRVAKQQTGTD